MRQHQLWQWQSPELLPPLPVTEEQRQDTFSRLVVIINHSKHAQRVQSSSVSIQGSIAARNCWHHDSVVGHCHWCLQQKISGQRCCNLMPQFQMNRLLQGSVNHSTAACNACLKSSCKRNLLSSMCSHKRSKWHSVHLPNKSSSSKNVQPCDWLQWHLHFQSDKPPCI